MFTVEILNHHKTAAEGDKHRPTWPWCEAARSTPPMQSLLLRHAITGVATNIYHVSVLSLHQIKFHQRISVINSHDMEKLQYLSSDIHTYHIDIVNILILNTLELHSYHIDIHISQDPPMDEPKNPRFDPVELHSWTDAPLPLEICKERPQRRAVNVAEPEAHTGLLKHIKTSN